MNVFIPSPLRSYTKDQPRVTASGSTIRSMLEDLDRQFPGFRFRMVDEQDQIRTHIKVFVNREQVRTIDESVNKNDEILILCALSGG